MVEFLTKYKTKFFFWTAFAFSLISFSAFIYYIVILSLSFQNKLSNSTQTTYMIFAISSAIHVWYVQVGIIFAFLTIPLNIYLLINDFKKYYLLSILIFGNVFYFTKYLFGYIFRKVPKKKIGKKTIIAISSVVMSSILIIPMIPFVIGRDSFYVDEPSKTYQDVSFSLDPKTPNTIEFFEDGINPTHFLENKNLSFMEGFYIFDNTTTSAFMTQQSHSRMIGGENSWDPKASHINGIRKNLFINHSTDVYQKNYINMMGHGRIPFKSFSAGGFGYAPDAEAKEKDKNIHFLNFGQAREIQARKNNGFSQKFGPTAAIYETFIGGIHKQDTSKKEKPSHTYMQGELFHGPRKAHSDGTLGLFNTGFKDVNEYSRNMLSRIIAKLKSIRLKPSDPDSFNAYDNTNIFIYGDHGAHTFREPKVYQSFDERKNRSIFMVKPAITTHAKKTAPIMESDKYLWAPHLRNIINHLTKQGGQQLTKIGDFQTWIDSPVIKQNFINRPTLSFGRYDSGTARTPYFTTTQPYDVADPRHGYNHLVDHSYDFIDKSGKQVKGTKKWFSIDKEIGHHVFFDILKELKWKE